MNLKKLSYIILVIVLSVSLFLGFIVDTFNVDVGYLNNVLKKVSSPFVLAVGIVFAMSMGEVYSRFNNLMSKKMLQYSVVALGFGMNIEKALASGWEGMLLTVVSVFATLSLGWVIGRKILGVNSETSYLLSSGTAICGGSAIAAVGMTYVFALVVTNSNVPRKALPPLHAQSLCAHCSRNVSRRPATLKFKVMRELS